MEEANKNKESIFKNIAGLIPLLTVIIIILGMMKQILFYENFNLPIKYFLGLSELGLIISDDLLIIAPILFILIIFVQNDLLEHLFIKNKSAPYKFKLGIKLFFLALALGAISLYFFYSLYLIRLALTSLIIFIFSGCFIVFFEELTLKIFPDGKIPYIIVIVIGVTGLMLIKTAYDIKLVDQLHKYKGTLVKTVDSTYVSTDSSYFIGKTDKYVFIYNKKDSTTDIISTESVKQIIMKSK